MTQLGAAPLGGAALAATAGAAALPLMLMPPAVGTTRDTTIVVVARATSRARHLDRDGRERVTAEVIRLLVRAGLATTWPARLPTSAELAAARGQAVIVVPSVPELEVTTTGTQAQITCTVELRVAPWYGIDGGERWEPRTTAMVTGRGRALASSRPRQIALAIRDCLDGAAEAAISRRLAPFLVAARS